jgi:urease accessory protein
LLEAEDGRVVEIIAAPELVMKVTANSHKELIAAAYHLGNRHVSLEIRESFLLLERDHVLKEMLTGLGVNVDDEISPYEPEPGAYGGGHRHGDDEPSIRPPARILRNG